MHNLVEPVNKDLEFQLHEPFLLYRNASCEYMCFIKVLTYLRLQLSELNFYRHFSFGVTNHNTKCGLFCFRVISESVEQNQTI